MQNGVDRIRVEVQRILHAAQERVADLLAIRAVDESFFQQIVHRLEAVTHAERHPQLLKAPRRQRITARQAHIVLQQVIDDVAHALHVIRVTLKVQVILGAHARIRGAIHIVGVMIDRRQATGDERFPQTFRREREIARDAEAAVTLAQHTPPIDLQLPADPFRIAHDVVGAEQLQIVGLFLRRLESALRIDN